MSYLLFGLVAAAYGFLAYYVTSYLYLGIVIGLAFLGLGMFYYAPMLKKRRVKERKRHECYHFVNTFLIDLSVTKSVDLAYESSVSEVNGELKTICDGISDREALEKIEYLQSYFGEPYYPMFASMVRLYLEQGGDVLQMAEPLLKECSSCEKHGDSLDKNRNSYLLQMIALWGLSYVVLLLIRTSLNAFYINLSKSIAYVVVASLYFFLAMIGLYLFFRRYGDQDEMKWGLKKHAKTMEN